MKMKIPYKMITSSFILVGLLSLTACGSSGNQQSAKPTPTVPNITAPTPTAPDTTTPLPTVNPSPSQPIAPQTGSTPPVSNTSKQLKDMLELAKQGKVRDVPFAAHNGLIDDVEKAWGKADKKEPAGAGFYATYSKDNTVFGFNKGSQIFDVRSNDPQVQKLTLTQIEQALGKPEDTKANGDDTIYIYNANKQFQLKFIIPKSTGKVDHISVFSPQDSINNMAAK